MNEEAEREMEVFAEAIKVPLEQRAALLKKMCGEDQNLHRRVIALLRAYDRIGTFLEEPPPG